MAASYPSTYPTRAKVLFDSGWTNCSELARLLEAELGRRPAHSTIRRWVDPDFAEVVRIRQRRGGICGPTRRLSAELRLERLLALAGAGLADLDVARVLNLDFGLRLTADNVEYLRDAEPSAAVAKRLLGRGDGR
jgi:hypothetical protein